MSEKETFVCKRCDMHCTVTAMVTMEEDWPRFCPFGVLPTGGYVNEPVFKKKVEK
jgi:hypothetical protein